MSREIWNEGRVVGSSAYEIYVKQHLSEYPEVPPATERQWLAASLAMGSSMILKMPNVTGVTPQTPVTVDVVLPSNCRLSAANTIVASFFDGEVSIDSTGKWATNVTSYGKLIGNNATENPGDATYTTQNLSSIPQNASGYNEATMIAKLKDYCNIVDGIIIQAGTWSDSDAAAPEKDLVPDLGDGALLRFTVRNHNITNSPLILLTGFTLRYVLSGVAGLDGSTNTPTPGDGDFLGPSVFPWANKIIFTVPNQYISYVASQDYLRSVPSSAAAQLVTDTPVIDMKATRPETYYNGSNARVAINVERFSTMGDGTPVLTVYQKSSSYPPALYGTYVTQGLTNYLCPLDSVAPGSVKMFQNATQSTLTDYENTFDGTFAVNRNNDGTLQTLDSNNNMVSVADSKLVDVNYTSRDNSHAKAKAVVTSTGTKRAASVSVSGALGSSADPTQYTFSSAPSSTITPDTNGNITWAMLFEAMANDLGVDLLEAALKDFKSHLPDVQSGANGVLKILGTGQSSVAGTFAANGTGTHTFAGDVQVVSGKTVKVGKNYIEFNGLRLYISSTAPTDTDVPVGSIGIGWGFI